MANRPHRTRSRRSLRLNLGCGGRPLPGFVNVDSDSLSQLKARYPHQRFPAGVKVYKYNIFHLPFPDGSVDEIRADSLIEHLSFMEEPRFFLEVKRALRPGGLLELSTPDFEVAVKQWLHAKDEWREFYRTDLEAIRSQHWFGQYKRDTSQRWGYLLTTIFGNQNGRGQFHRNAYTIPKLRAILRRLNFKVRKVSHYLWKGDRDVMIRLLAEKLPDRRRPVPVPRLRR